MSTGNMQRSERGRNFPTADVVGAIEGHLLGDFGGVVAVLSYLHGRDLWTHELPQAGRDARMSAELPEWLLSLDLSHVTRENWRSVRDDLIATHGQTVTLTPISWSRLAERSPVETAVEMFGADRVIPAEAPND